MSLSPLHSHFFLIFQEFRCSDCFRVQPLTQVWSKQEIFPWENKPFPPSEWQSCLGGMDSCKSGCQNAYLSVIAEKKMFFFTWDHKAVLSWCVKELFYPDFFMVKTFLKKMPSLLLTYVHLQVCYFLLRNKMGCICYSSVTQMPFKICNTEKTWW